MKTNILKPLRMLRHAVLGALLLAPAAEGALDPVALLKKVDELYRADSSQGTLEMTIQTPHWSRTLSMRIWTRSMNDTLITIDRPKKDHGISTLRLNREMWNYFPKINRVMKVPPSMMMGSWMGSDFTNDDLVRETSLTEEYTLTLPKDKQTEETHFLVLTPKKDAPTVWGRIEIVVEKKRLLPRTQTYFDEKGEAIRRMTLTEVKRFGTREIPSKLTMKNLKKKKQSTTIVYKNMKFNEKLPGNIFSLQYLQRKNK